MTVTKLTAADADRYTKYQRHILHKLRAEEATTRNPDRLRDYTDFARLSIICARRGYMLNA
jgi:hypothetical protein